MKTQVLIVGAGPVGLTLAAELARYGVHVRVVEQAAQRTDKSKALVLWSRTLELLDRAGCTAAFVAAGRPVNGANIIAHGEQMGHLDMRPLQTPYPYALMIPQSETERLLEAHAQGLGVIVERRTQLASFTDDGGGVSAVIVDANGHAETVEADWLVGCDGAHSTVRHALGLSFQGSTMQSDWLLADVHLKGYPFPETDLTIYWHPNGVLAIFPITPGRFRVIADVGLSASGPPSEPTLDQVQAMVEQRGAPGMTVSDPFWLSAFRINERKVDRYRVGRVFVAGDAAHVHSPAGGQGMNTGMQDAVNLAWKLAAVCHGTCGEQVLDSYSAERGAVGDQVLKAAGRLTTVATLRNPVAQAVRNFFGHALLGLAPVRDAMIESMSELSIAYADSPLNGQPAHGIDGPKAGERMAPVRGQRAVGSGDRPRFALFAPSSSEADALAGRFAGLLEPQVRPPLHAGGMVLVRPDGYVACVARGDDVAKMQRYLEALA